MIGYQKWLYSDTTQCINGGETMHGFYNRILMIDATRQQYRIQTIDDETLRASLGGKGLASYLLYQFNPPGIDPFDGENHIILATGPLGGSPVWGACRYGVFTKSPQTGVYAESYSGGRTPEAIDATGYDAIVISGKAQSPISLAVDPVGVTFHSADKLWGMETYATEDALKKQFRSDKNDGYKKSGAIVIGPAAENLVRFSVIENDYWRSAGRTGVGAVLGSKKIKGIFFSGDRKRELYDGKGILAFSTQLMRKFKDQPVTHAYRNLGTPMMVKILNEAGAFPTRYWEKGTCEHWEKISADALHEKCDVRPNACRKCFLACGKLCTVKGGRHSGLKIEGPEYETIYAFGGLCMVDSIEEIIYLNDICDRLGMDTITAGNLCAFTIHAVKQGRLAYPIDYGDADAISDLLHKIAYRKDIGEVLASGIREAAKAWDLIDVPVHVKGLEPAGYDPRVLKGMGLGYATSDRGACHLRATFYKPELSGIIPPEAIEGKAELFIDYENRMTLFDTLILCRFYRDFYAWDSLAKMIRMSTGGDFKEVDLEKIANGISTMIRTFNLREGMTSDDDVLPKAFHKAMQGTDSVIKEEELQYMKNRYYRLHGWDENGVPNQRGWWDNPIV